MKPSRSKRPRLISISSNISSPWPDLPATFESLNDDTLTTTFQFVGDKSYKSFGGINKRCKEVYLSTEGMTKETFLYGYAPLSVITDKIEKAILDYDWEVFERVGKGVVLYNRRDVFEWALHQDRNEYLLRGICFVAAKEGRTGLLNEVWNNVDNEDDKEYIISDIDGHAARGGKLNVLKWYETKGFSINKVYCAREASEYGKLDILKWLQEEKSLELERELYENAAIGGQLNVMKWLREQEVPWSHFTFYYAATRKGNLDVLQWLHDEGCPWPDYVNVLVREEDLKPEVVDWCRVNGYGGMIE